MSKPPKKDRKKWLLLLLLLFFLLLFSCTLISYINNNFFREEIEGVPSQISKDLTQEDLDHLEELDFPIHYGLNPPTIDGTYLFDSQRVDYDEDSLLKVNSKIKDQTDRYYNLTENLEISIESITQKGGQKRNASGYISGEGSCFTIFDIGKTKKPYGCVTTEAVISSGCLGGDGNISDFRQAILMLKHNSKLLCTTIPERRKEPHPIPAGNTRLISERDGLAEKQD